MYQITMSVFSLFVTLTSSGLPLVVSKRTAELAFAGGGSDVEKKRGSGGTVFAALIIALIVSIIAVAVFYFGRGLLSAIFADKRNAEMLVVLLPAVVVSSFYSVFRGGLWGKKKFFTYGLLEFIEQYVRVGIGVIMLQGVLTLTQGTMRAALSLSISYLAAAVVSAVVYFAAGERLSDPRPHFRPVLKSAAPITFIRIAGNLMASLIAIIVPLRLISYGLDRTTALAQFGSAAGMALPLLSIPITLVSSLAMALVPELSSVKDKSNLHGDINYSIKLSIVLGGLFVAFFFVAGRDVAALIYKDKLAGEIVRFGAFSVIPSALSLISGSILNSLGLEMKALKGYLASSALLLAGTWLLPSFMGINGMIIASFVAGALTCVLNIIMINKVVPVGAGTAKSLLITVALIVPVILICHFLRPLLLAFLPAYAAIIIICGVSALLYLLSCSVFNLFDFRAIFKALRIRG